MASGKIEKVTSESGAGYCKMPDGMLICWGKITTGTYNATTAWGAFYETPSISVSVTFPISFIEAPDVFYKCRCIGAQCFLEDGTNISSAGIGGNINLWRPTAHEVNAYISWLAVGRWK